MKSLVCLCLLFSACSKKTYNERVDDEYVLVEFAARLEEDQEKFQKLEKPTTDP